MAEPLRITVVSRRVDPAHGPGGLERAVREQVLEAAAAGFSVDLWAERPADEARSAAAEEQLGGDVRLHWVDRAPLPLGSRPGTVVLDRITNYPLWSRRVAAAIEDPGDVTHVHGLAGLGVARLRERGRWTAPIVLNPHGLEEFFRRGPKHLAYAPFRAGMRRIAKAADRVIVTDAVLWEPVTRLLGVDEERAVVIPNAVYAQAGPDQADLAAAAKFLAEQGQAGRNVYLSVGRLEANKGFDLLASAFGAAAGDLGDWCWVLVGSGPELEAVRSAVREAGIAERVVLAGSVDEGLKHGLYASSKWFVHPTLFEGSSVVTLEAMAHGLPVLGTRAGGLPDKIEDGASGYLVSPGDPEALSRGLRRTIKANAGTMGARGRAIIEERFSWEVIRPRLAQLYRELAGRA
jgi:glycosyltransferase involved in cell wall biosynthesis